MGKGNKKRTRVACAVNSHSKAVSMWLHRAYSKYSHEKGYVNRYDEQNCIFVTYVLPTLPKVFFINERVSNFYPFWLVGCWLFAPPRLLSGQAKDAYR